LDITYFKIAVQNGVFTQISVLKSLQVLQNSPLSGVLKFPSQSGNSFFLSAFGNSDDGFFFRDNGNDINNKTLYPSLILKNRKTI